MFKLRFGLRFLLALPLCVGAFYLGWTSHASSLRLEHQRDAQLAEQRRTEIIDEMSQQRIVDAMKLNDAVDRNEQRSRLKNFERMIDDPFGARMLPGRAY